MQKQLSGIPVLGSLATSLSGFKQSRNLDDARWAKIAGLEKKFGLEKFLYALDFSQGKAVMSFYYDQDDLSKSFDSLLKMVSRIALENWPEELQPN